MGFYSALVGECERGVGGNWRERKMVVDEWMENLLYRTDDEFFFWVRQQQHIQKHRENERKKMITRG